MGRRKEGEVQLETVSAKMETVAPKKSSKRREKRGAADDEDDNPNVVPLNLNVDRIWRGGRDITAVVMDVLATRDIRQRVTLRRYKNAIAHCINADRVKKDQSVKPVAERTLETMLIDDPKDVDNKILQAATLFIISWPTLNALLIEIDQRLATIRNAPPVLDDYSFAAAEDTVKKEPETVNGEANKENTNGILDAIKTDSSGDERPVLTIASPLLVKRPQKRRSRGERDRAVLVVRDCNGAETDASSTPDANDAEAGQEGGEEGEAEQEEGEEEPGDPERSFVGRQFVTATPFGGDYVDETKSKEERVRSFVHQVLFHVEGDERKYLEWVVQLMLDPSFYAKLPSVYERNKVLGYFKVILPSILTSDFYPEPARFFDSVTERRVVTIHRRHNCITSLGWNDESALAAREAQEADDAANAHVLEEVFDRYLKEQEEEERLQAEREEREEAEREFCEIVEDEEEEEDDDSEDDYDEEEENEEDEDNESMWEQAEEKEEGEEESEDEVESMVDRKKEELTEVKMDEGEMEEEGEENSQGDDEKELGGWEWLEEDEARRREAGMLEEEEEKNHVEKRLPVFTEGGQDTFGPEFFATPASSGEGVQKEEEGEEEEEEEVESGEDSEYEEEEAGNESSGCENEEEVSERSGLFRDSSSSEREDELVVVDVEGMEEDIERAERGRKKMLRDERGKEEEHEEETADCSTDGNGRSENGAEEGEVEEEVRGEQIQEEGGGVNVEEEREEETYEDEEEEEEHGEKTTEMREEDGAPVEEEEEDGEVTTEMREEDVDVEGVEPAEDEGEEEEEDEKTTEMREKEEHDEQEEEHSKETPTLESGTRTGGEKIEPPPNLANVTVSRGRKIAVGKEEEKEEDEEDDESSAEEEEEEEDEVPQKATPRRSPRTLPMVDYMMRGGRKMMKNGEGKKKEIKVEEEEETLNEVVVPVNADCPVTPANAKQKGSSLSPQSGSPNRRKRRAESIVSSANKRRSPRIMQMEEQNTNAAKRRKLETGVICIE